MIPLGRPVEPAYISYKRSMDDIIKRAYENLSLIKLKGEDDSRGRGKGQDRK